MATDDDARLAVRAAEHEPSRALAWLAVHMLWHLGECEGKEVRDLFSELRLISTGAFSGRNPRLRAASCRLRSTDPRCHPRTLCRRLRDPHSKAIPTTDLLRRGFPARLAGSSSFGAIEAPLPPSSGEGNAP